MFSFSALVHDLHESFFLVVVYRDCRRIAFIAFACLALALQVEGLGKSDMTKIDTNTIFFSFFKSIATSTPMVPVQFRSTRVLHSS